MFLNRIASSRNQGPILVLLTGRCRDIAYNRKGSIILRTTHADPMHLFRLLGRGVRV